MLSREVLMMEDGSPMLYDRGLTYNNKTGGWETEVAPGMWNSGSLSKLTMSADCMERKAGNMVDYQTVYRCTLPIDLTQWDRIKVEYSFTSGYNHVYFFFGTMATPVFNNVSISERGDSTSGIATVESNITSVVGSRHIVLGVIKRTNVTTTQTALKVYRVWLE